MHLAQWLIEFDDLSSPSKYVANHTQRSGHGKTDD